MKTWKKWLIALFSILLLAGISLGVVWTVDNWSAITSNTTLYTQEDLDNAYDKGLNDAGYDMIVQYQEQIAGLQKQVADSTKNLQDALNQNNIDAARIEGLNNELSSVKNELSDALSQLENFLHEIQDKTEQINNLTNILEETQAQLQSTISQLETTTSQLDEALAQGELDAETISDLTSQVEDLSEQNESLSSQVVNLNNQVLELQAQLEAYESMNLENYYKVTFINDSNDAIVSTSYIQKNSSLNNPPIIENTYDYWFYGWATTEDSEDVVNFDSFIVDNNYIFYSILSPNIDLRIVGDENFFKYEENEMGENANAYSAQAIYRYGENLTVADILQVKDKVILQGLEEGDITFQFNEDVTLETKLKDLPDGGAVLGNYKWSYKELSCKLILQYSESLVNIVTASSVDDSNSYVAYEMDFGDFPRVLDITTTNNISLEITYKDETVNSTITSLNTKEYEAVGIKKYSNIFYVIKFTPFEDKEIEVCFLMSIDGDGYYAIAVIDPSVPDDAGLYEYEAGFKILNLNVEYQDKYISYLQGFENHEFWYYENALIEEV